MNDAARNAGMEAHLEDLYTRLIMGNLLEDVSCKFRYHNGRMDMSLTCFLGGTTTPFTSLIHLAQILIVELPNSANLVDHAATLATLALCIGAS